MSGGSPISHALSAEPHGWWSRPCGVREVLAISLPLVISTASWTAMHFVDRMFLTWYSADAIAAAMPAGVLSFAVACFPLYVANYVNTFVAQYHGANRPERIGASIWQAVWIALLFIPVFLATIPLAPLVFQAAGHEPHIAALEADYYRVLTYGAGGMLLSGALSGFFIGRGEVRVVMLANLLSAAMNIGLDYLWIFGRLGFPEGGIVGAGWATVVSTWSMAVLYACLMLRPRYRHRYGILRGWRYDRELMGRLLWYGVPSSVQVTLNVAAFTAFILLIGSLGKEAMAATTLAFNVESLSFVPMTGLGMAAAALVGQQLGANRPHLAARAAWTTWVIAVGYAGTLSVLFLTVPELFLAGHAAKADAEEFAVLSGIAVVLLRFVAAYCVFDATQLIFCSAIKGAGDTRFVLITTLITAPAPVLIAWLGMRYAGWGLYWCWAMITVWVVVLCAIYFGRFLQGTWREMRVIEPTVIPETPVHFEPVAAESLAAGPAPIPRPASASHASKTGVLPDPTEGPFPARNKAKSSTAVDPAEALPRTDP